MKELRELQRRTGLSLAECNRALAKAGGDIDTALELLRASGAIRGRSIELLRSDVVSLAEDWARSFLEDTRETGELAEYCAKGELETIRENYYHWYIVGTPSSLHRALEGELESQPGDQRDALEELAYSAYVEWVDRLLPEYL